MSDHVVAIVQARLGSKRLPRKALADIGGKPMVLRVLERVAQAKGIHTTVAAIPDSDVELAGVLKQAGWTVVQGPENDVLKRYVLAAKATGADVIVRICGDCPLVSPVNISILLHQVLSAPTRYYTSSCTGDGGVDGLDIEVFRRWILDAADREATESYDREHVTSWIRQRTLTATPPGKSGWPFKLSVDTADDLLAVRKVYENLGTRVSDRDILIAASRAGVWDYDR